MTTTTPTTTPNATGGSFGAAAPKLERPTARTQDRHRSALPLDATGCAGVGPGQNIDRASGA